MTEQVPKRVLLVGNASSLLPVLKSSLSPDFEIVTASRLPTRSAENDHFDLLVVFQSWLDEFVPDDIEMVFQSFPLTRIIVCLGPLCLSAGRTRPHWPFSSCVDLKGFPVRLNQELQILAGTLSPLAVTAGYEEIFRFDYLADQDATN